MFPGTFPEIMECPPAVPHPSLAAHRDRLRARGFQRLEVQVPREDSALIRAVATALADPARAAAARALLRARFAAEPVQGLKALLEAAPLEDVPLDRPRDTGRTVDL